MKFKVRLKNNNTYLALFATWREIVKNDQLTTAILAKLNYFQPQIPQINTNQIRTTEV